MPPVFWWSAIRMEDIVLQSHFSKCSRIQGFAGWQRRLLDFGIRQYQENYADTYRDTSFELYQKYTYEDVCRL